MPATRLSTTLARLTHRPHANLTAHHNLHLHPVSLIPRSSIRHQSSTPSPDSPEHRPTTSQLYFRPFFRPFAKTFLIALFIHQVLYWIWEKLRLDELREEREGEMRRLEESIKAYRVRREEEVRVGARGSGGVGGGVGEKVGESGGRGGKGWFGW